MKRCDRCERRLKDGEWVFSPNRRVWYCPPAKWKACDKKFKQRQALSELTQMSQDLPGGYR